MGQIKKLLEETELVIPDNLDIEYQEWLDMKKAEISAYEEHLADIANNINFEN